MRRRSLSATTLLPLALALVLAAGPRPAAAETESFFDPLEGFNQPMFGINRGVDAAALRPLSMVYREVLPQPVRQGVTNLLANLEAPREALNHLLQFDLDATAVTTARFLINTTVGVAGIADVASEVGLERQPTDFGLTLARYGVGEGAYLVIPVLGPSTLRDFAGLVTDVALNPLHVSSLVELKALEWGGYYTLAATDFRERNAMLLDEVYHEDDFGYPRLRAYYLQNRRHSAGGGAIDAAALPDLGLEDDPLVGIGDDEPGTHGDGDDPDG